MRTFPGYLYFSIVTLYDIHGIYQGFHTHKLFTVVMCMILVVIMMILWVYLISGNIKHKERMQELTRLIRESEKKIFENKLN